MNNTANNTIIRWYNGVEYTIAELFSMQNVVIEGRNLTEIIQHVLAHGSFNPTCAANNMPRFGLAIKLVHRGDDAETMREIEKLERKLHAAEFRLWQGKNGKGSFHSIYSAMATIDFLERRIKELYAR